MRSRRCSGIGWRSKLDLVEVQQRPLLHHRLAGRAQPATSAVSSTWSFTPLRSPRSSQRDSDEPAVKPVATECRGGAGPALYRRYTAHLQSQCMTTTSKSLTIRRNVGVLLGLGVFVTLALPPGVSLGQDAPGTCSTQRTLPCSATGLQTYSDRTLGREGNDDQASVESVLRHVVGDVVRIRPLVTGVTKDEGPVRLEPANVTGGTAFAWSYADATESLAYVTVKAVTGFAVFAVAGTTTGNIDVSALLGGHDISHVGFWAATVSTPTPVRATRRHSADPLDPRGHGMLANARLGRIERGTVPCVHVETADVAQCRFGRHSGSWVESASGEYALVGQSLSLDGTPGGDYVVSARINRDGTVPALEPSGYDTAGTSPSQELAAGYVVETLGASTNVSGRLLQNDATLEVCTSSYPHPDGARLTRSPTAGIYCYVGPGAGLNDLNGTERDSYGVYYSEEFYAHVAWISGVETVVAKRPATVSYPAPGRVKTDSPIQWRPVNNNLRIAN